MMRVEETVITGIDIMTLEEGMLIGEGTKEIVGIGIMMIERWFMVQILGIQIAVGIEILKMAREQKQLEKTP